MVSVEHTGLSLSQDKSISVLSSRKTPIRCAGSVCVASSRSSCFQIPFCDEGSNIIFYHFGWCVLGECVSRSVLVDSWRCTTAKGISDSPCYSTVPINRTQCMVSSMFMFWQCITWIYHMWPVHGVCLLFLVSHLFLWSSEVSVKLDEWPQWTTVTLFDDFFLYSTYVWYQGGAPGLLQKLGHVLGPHWSDYLSNNVPTLLLSFCQHKLSFPTYYSLFIFSDITFLCYYLLIIFLQCVHSLNASDTAWVPAGMLQQY